MIRGFSRQRKVFEEWVIRCKKRNCWRCSCTNAFILKQDVIQHFGEQRLWELNLTIRPTHQTLRRQVQTLLRCFRELRRRAAWRRQIVGGVYNLGLGHAYHGPRWSPHLHCVVEAEAVETPALIAGWASITKGSFVVYAKAIAQTNVEDRVGYQVKSAMTEFFRDADAVAEFAAQCAGLHLHHPFDRWRPIVRQARRDRREARRSEFVGVPIDDGPGLTPEQLLEARIEAELILSADRINSAQGTDSSG